MQTWQTWDKMIFFSCLLVSPLWSFSIDHFIVFICASPKLIFQLFMFDCKSLSDFFSLSLAPAIRSISGPPGPDRPGVFTVRCCLPAFFACLYVYVLPLIVVVSLHVLLIYFLCCFYVCCLLYIFIPFRVASISVCQLTRGNWFRMKIKKKSVFVHFACCQHVHVSELLFSLKFNSVNFSLL